MAKRTTAARRPRRKHNPLEFFETPPGFTRFLDHNLHIDGRVYCPTVGEGAVVRALNENPDGARTFVTNDLDPARPADSHLDATSPEAWWFGEALASIGRGPHPDWVVDNPPFSAAHDILFNALPVVRVGIALHLRVSFPEPTFEREALLGAHPPDAMFVLPRYSFSVSPTTGKRSTDAVTTAWYVWLSETERRRQVREASDYPFRDGRRILVAPRTVADEGWHDQGTGVPPHPADATGGDPA